jgi:hypothetical protein
MAIDEEDDETETEEDETPKKKGKKTPAKKTAKAKLPPELDARPFAGGNSTVPLHTKPKGVAAKVRARTFETWVTGLMKRETPPHHFKLELPSGDEKPILLQRSRSGNILIGECISTIETFEPVKVEAFSRNEETDEEMSLGQWAFPPKIEDASTTETSTGTGTSAPIPPGYLLSEDDTSIERMVKTCVHMIADAYRYNLEAMARVMESQAGAFAKERESMTRAMQAAEKTARIKASKYRVAAGVPNATEAGAVDPGYEDEPEEESANDKLMQVMFDAAGRELAKKFTQEAAPSTASSSSPTP